MKLLNSVSLPLQKETEQPSRYPEGSFFTVGRVINMMTPENIPAKPAAKDESQSSGSRKTASARPPEQALKCPRCDSSNTKFCYYNNYSLTQPRHFCKTCRRYWTKGGALRNVPIGGGCRKSKKLKSSSKVSGDSKDSSGSSDIGGLKLFQGLSPAMDFQLGSLSFPRLHSSTAGGYNQFSSFGEISSAPSSIPTASAFGIDGLGNSSPLMGLNFTLPSPVQEMGSMSTAVHGNLASSIESLSSINQDLHWKLQQQRLAMLWGGENQRDSSVQSTMALDIQAPRTQPIMFQNLEISKPEVCAGGNSRKDSATEWFFDGSYAPVNPTPADSTSNANESTSNWSGIQAWTDLNQYSALP